MNAESSSGDVTEQGSDTTKNTRLQSVHSTASIRGLSSGFDPVSLGNLGRYRMIREIGRGGYGIVYLAEDTQLGRNVAIKIARPEIVSDEEGVSRFQRESRAAATLEHPGIVPVFDCGEEDGLHYYVMPYLDSENLAQWLVTQSEPLSEHVVAQFMLDLVRAVEFGHRQGVIHRDLKPQNILLKIDESNPNGFRPVVLDFGLCGLVECGSTTTSVLTGTPRYMSPEQAMFGKRKITERSDIYSLGVILYQMLTGNPPHQSDSIMEAVLMLHSTPVISPRKLRSDLSPAMEAICLKCLRKDCDRRYESAGAFATDLENLLANAPVAARPEGWWERIDFAIRYGDWETRLGLGVIAINTTSYIWALAGAFLIQSRFRLDGNVIEGIGELFAFLVFLALPIHVFGVYLGWLMTRRTKFVRRLTAGAIGSGLWAINNWYGLSSDQAFLRIYEDQGYTQVMVLLLLSSAFALQSFFLAVGAWAARCRNQD